MLASIGIVCLDEFDKIASGQNNAIFAGAGTTKDVTGMGVQRELLKMLEASEVVVPLDLTHSLVRRPRRDVDRRHRVHRRGRVLRLPADRPSPRDARLRSALAATRRPAATDPDAIAVDFTAEQVENVANFQAYGFLPELVARFTRVVPFQALDAGTLKDILRTDVIARMTREFKLEGFELVIDEAVLDHIVDDALEPRDRRARPGLDADPPASRTSRSARSASSPVAWSMSCCAMATSRSRFANSLVRGVDLVDDAADAAGSGADARARAACPGHRS